MKVEFKNSFVKDLRRIRNQSLRSRVKEVIESVEQAQIFHELENVKKLSAQGRYYRIRLGNYRIGLRLEGDTLIFV